MIIKIGLIEISLNCLNLSLDDTIKIITVIASIIVVVKGFIELEINRQAKILEKVNFEKYCKIEKTMLELLDIEYITNFINDFSACRQLEQNKLIPRINRVFESKESLKKYEQKIKSINSRLLFNPGFEESLQYIISYIDHIIMLYNKSENFIDSNPIVKVQLTEELYILLNKSIVELQKSYKHKNLIKLEQTKVKNAKYCKKLGLKINKQLQSTFLNKLMNMIEMNIILKKKGVILEDKNQSLQRLKELIEDKEKRRELSFQEIKIITDTIEVIEIIKKCENCTEKCICNKK